MMATILIALHVAGLILLWGILATLHELRDALLVLTAQPLPVAQPPQTSPTLGELQRHNPHDP